MCKKVFGGKNLNIKEVIVVEGRHDTIAIKNAVEADTIETGGSAISKETIERIRKAQELRGIIVLTDPDYPGERIRKIISNSVPGVKHAFLAKEDALKNNDVGIENASPESIRRALNDVKTEWIAPEETISWETLVDHGLVGGEKAKEKRLQLGKRLGIGYCNAKQLHKRLKMFQVEEEAFLEVMTKINKGDDHE